jgi:protein SERAC1
LQIVSDESAILSAYPNGSIHANHTEMVRFSSVKDDGYIAVSGQLWLWTDALQQAAEAKAKAQAALTSSQASSEDNTFEMMRDANSQMIGSVTSNGGPIFLGNNNAGRNINVNTIFR